MKINTQAGLVAQATGQVKVEKKEGDQKEQVQLGTNEPTPEFMKKPQGGTIMSWEHSSVTTEHTSVTAKGCAEAGGALGVVVGGAFGTMAGAFDAGIGWAARGIWGPTGGAVATISIGALHFLKGVAGKDGSITKGLIGGATGAASTFLGAQFGGAGLFYGGMATGIPDAIIAGKTLAHAGAQVGGIIQAGGSPEDASAALEKEAKKSE